MDNCMIEDARASKHSSRQECKTCGWNPEIYQQRQMRLENGGLRRCQDGLCRLVLPKARKEGQK